MAKTYRATVGFACPADPESLKKWQAGKKDEASIMAVKKGDKVVPFSDDILKSWLANECVEEVKADG
jgi:hypothetical protein